MRFLRLYLPAATLFLICPVCAAVTSALSTRESVLIAQARGIEEEQQKRQEPANSPGALRKSPELSEADSQNELARAYLAGRGVPQDYAKAMRWYRKAADQGNADAQFSLGAMYAQGLGVPQDYKEAVKWYRKAADQGNADAQCYLGWIFCEGKGVPQDYAEAMRWYRKAADQGNADAQFSLGSVYAQGWGVPQDYTEAAKWYRRAADQGDAVAQSNLGWMFREGKGVAQDYTESVKWYRRAADQGNVDAQSNLGWMFREGKGVAQDYTESVKWYRRAADQGNVDAQYNLAGAYDSGKGVPQDYTEAAKWYRKAADQGNADAQFSLGLMYSEGRGVTRDGMEAAKWFRKALQSLDRSRWMRMILFVLLLLILPPVVIVVLLLIVSRHPLRRSSQEAGIAEHLEEDGSGQPRYPDIIAELEHLQNKRTSWTSAILVLIVSVALFIAVGAGAWSWDLLIMIVGILFVHEAGHYLAMRIFHYRNVRMFFIPFLGAAVSGQNYTAPGWKKVIVALMGPLPGILLGSAIGLAGLLWKSESMTKIAMTAVALNGFQLLPVLPLDGGRVMHALLFSRDHRLDALFRVLAAGALAGVGFLSGGWVFVFLGLFMLAGVQHEYKTARIAAELRRGEIERQMPAVSPGGESADSLPAMPQLAPRSFPESASTVPTAPPIVTALASTSVSTATQMPTPPSVEDDVVPQTIAEKIIERVKACFPQVNSPKQVAGLTLNVYESLATCPPGIRASIGFICLYYALCIIALVSTLLVALTGGK
jgi:TPR repeat protein